MKDNSPVVTLANTETSYAKKCKHFQRADIPRPDRGSQDIRQTEQRGFPYKTTTLLRISDYGT
jgi:hypothetical protein